MNVLKRLAFAAGLTTMVLGGVGAAHAQANKTFNIWWFEDPTSSEGIAWTKALNEFKAAHPDVTVNFQQKTFIQLQKAGSMILNSNQAPDITEYNKGNATAGLVASQGLLTPLDDEFKSRGWDKILNETNTQLSKYDREYGSSGIPSGRSKRAIRPLMSKRLAQEIDALDACDKDYFQRYGEILRARTWKAAIPWGGSRFVHGPG